MLQELFFVLWFFAPAGLANVTAFFSSKVPYIYKFTAPADGNLTFRKKRILGDHKTIRGFVFGTTCAIIGVCIQVWLYEHVSFLRQIVPLDYRAVNPLLLGFLLGFGALLGDAVKSFFKRQINIPPGKSWVPFDQVDYIIGGMILTWFYIQLTPLQYLLLLIAWVLIHPSVALLGYLFKLKKEPL